MKDNQAKSFVTMMIVISLSALLVRTGIQGLININISQDESNAEGTLKLIAASLENYAKDNHDKYPPNFSVLTQARPAYLDKDYIAQSPIKGYNYGCVRLEPSGYSCYARPARCGLTGGTTYTITTGSVLVSEACKKSE
jgi:competence protein ComGC